MRKHERKNYGSDEFVHSIHKCCLSIEEKDDSGANQILNNLLDRHLDRLFEWLSDYMRHKYSMDQKAKYITTVLLQSQHSGRFRNMPYFEDFLHRLIQTNDWDSAAKFLSICGQ